MQPPAEHVHWLFATGVLFLGALLARRGDRRPRGLATAARGGAYLWPALLFGLGVCMWPVMVFFTNSTVHMLAHGVVGAGDDARRRRRARPRQREAARASCWKLRVPARARRLGRRLPDPRAEPVALLALGVRPPRLRLDRCSLGALFPLGARVQAALAASSAPASRSSSSPSRSRSTARRDVAPDLRPPVARGGGAAPMRRLAARRPPSSRSRFPGAAFGARDARCRRRRASASGWPRLRGRSTLDVRPERARCSRTGSASTTRRAGSSPARRTASAGRPARGRGAAAAAADGRATRSAGARSRTTATSATASSRSASASTAPALEPGVRRVRARRPTEHVVRWLYFVCLALLTGGLGFRLLVLRGDVTPEARAALLPAHRHRRRRRARGRDRRVPAPRRRTRCSSRSRRSCTATCRRSRSDTRFGEAFVAMKLGFAFVAALLFLAWLTERRVAALAGVPALARPRLRALALEPPADDRGWLLVVRRLGAPVRGDALDRRAALARARRLARPRACAGRRSGGSRRSPGRSSRSSSPPAST